MPPRPSSPPRSSCFCFVLKSWLSILDQHFKVCLIPLSSLGTGLVGIALAAEGVVPSRAAIASTVALTTGLAPHKGVDKAGARVSRGPDTEASAVDIAPVAPFGAQTRDGVAARIDNGLAWHAVCNELRTDERDVELFVLRLVVLSVGRVCEFAG